MKIRLGLLLLLTSVAVPAYAQSKLRLIEKSGDSRSYSGQVRLSGKYSVYYDGSDFDGNLSFWEDKASHKKLPSNGWREGVIMLRPLRDSADLLPIFSIPAERDPSTCGYEGRATIDIKNFEAFKAGSETGDRATLVRIVSRTKPKRVACEKPRAKAALSLPGAYLIRTLAVSRWMLDNFDHHTNAY